MQLSFFKKVVFSLIPLLLLFILLEVGFRIISRARFAKYQANFSIQGNSRWISHPFLVWTNRPRYLDLAYHSQYNEYGMRVPPGDIRMPDKQQGDFWVFLLGGSAMAGMGSNLNEDWIKITGVDTHEIEHSIDGYLQNELQQQLPNRRVRVFNAAISSHTIAQSRLRYELLKPLKPDWIISMDGYNDPHRLEPGMTTYQQLLHQWQNHPVNRFPFTWGRLVMRHSAFLFVLGEYFFLKSGIMRNPVNSQADETVREFWQHKFNDTSQRWEELDSAPFHQNDEEQRAEDEFIRHLVEFHTTLKYDQQKHLLLVQPEVSLKLPSKINHPVEQAVYSYYYRSPERKPDTFLQSIHRRVANELAAQKEIVSMAAMHYWEEWVFVDYCHFTRLANKKIAEEVAQYILSEGLYEPFSL